MAVLSITSQVAMALVGHAIQAPVFQALGLKHWAVPTVVLAGHAGEARMGGGAVPEVMLADLIDAAIENPRFETCQAVMSGYLGKVTAVAAVEHAVRAARKLSTVVPYYCDPVIGDDLGGDVGFYVPVELAEVIRDRLVPIADVIFPNRFEAAWMSGQSIETPDDAIRAANTLIARGTKACVVTGVPAPGAMLVSTYVGPEGTYTAAGPCVETPAKGAGDLFAALFVGHSVHGEPRDRALELASIGAGRGMAFAADDDLFDIPIIEKLNAIVDVEGPIGLLFDKTP